MRIGKKPLMILRNQRVEIPGIVSPEDLAFVISTASQYSPWAAATISEGYITCAGGHRIGICGEAVCRDGLVAGVRTPTSLCIRVARDFYGIAGGCENLPGNILIIGPPGSGKTTLLRDLIRRKSNNGQGSIAVIDERREIFPFAQGRSCFAEGQNTDIMSGAPKPLGVDMVLRTMGPACIAMDEITNERDADALLQAAWNGVGLVATAHAGSLAELHRRIVYRTILQGGVFHSVIILSPDKSWTVEGL